jgi:hypothetical protein
MAYGAMFAIVINTSLGEVASLSLRGAADHVFPFAVLVLLQQDVM